MIKINGEQIKIIGSASKFTLSPIGGPQDPIELAGHGIVELSADEWDQLQAALVNFSNTGYFDQEG